MNKNLLLIDMQKDLCDTFGKFYVDKSEPIIRNFASEIKTSWDGIKASKLPNLIVALKTHESVHICHQSFWNNENHQPPMLGTIITAKDAADGKWLPIDKTADEEVREFLKIIEEESYSPLKITPMHCLIGTSGHALHNDIVGIVEEWERLIGDSCMKILHGLRPLELYRQNPDSVISHISNDDVDPLFDGAYVFDVIANAELTGICGMSLTTTIAETILDLEELSIEPEKLVVISDGSPSMPDSDEDTKTFIKHLSEVGIKMMTVREFMNVV